MLCSSRCFIHWPINTKRVSGRSTSATECESKLQMVLGSVLRYIFREKVNHHSQHDSAACRLNINQWQRCQMSSHIQGRVLRATSAYNGSCMRNVSFVGKEDP